MVSITRIPCGIVNCYLVGGRERAILVDTAAAGQEERIFAACRGSAVSLIMLTHGHGDHIGNAAALSRRLGAPIAIGDGDEELIGDNLRQPLAGRGAAGKVLLAFSLRSLKGAAWEPFAPQIILRGGDSLEAYGVPATVVALPGHTRGSIGLDVGGTDLIVGDALMNFFRPSASLLCADEAAMLESARRVCAMGERTVHFGHGRPAPNRVRI